MSLFAIGDFHLSGEPPAKPMEVFSPNWENHFEKIRRNWLTKITETDTVIICGDTSWAMSLEAAMQDLNRIAALPPCRGKKSFCAATTITGGLR